MAVEWKKIAFADHNHTDADLNTVIGPNALVNPKPSTGRTNVAIGVKALNADLTGRGNVVVGPYCADSLTAGNDNVVIGLYAAHDGALSNENVLVGSNAGRKAEGHSNVAVGYGALYNNTSNKNLAVGRDAGYKNVTGTRNVFVGPSAGYYETGGDKLFIDNLTRTDEATARAKAMIYGVFHADPAYQYLTINAKVTISQNLKVGSDATITEFDTGALANLDTVVPTSKAVTTALTKEKIVGLKTTDSPEFNGLSLPHTSSDSTGIIFKGSEAVFHDFRHPTGNTARPVGGNFFIGVNSGNFTMGSTATETYHASYNTGIGGGALFALTTGYYNLAFGYAALTGNTAGHSNAAIGANALTANTIGVQNLALGMQALYYNTEGNNNIGIGYQALLNNTTAHNNIGIGYLAGRYTAASAANQTSSGCVFIGYLTRSSANGVSNEMALGYGAVGQGTNTIMLGNASITGLLCYDTSIASPSDSRIKKDVSSLSSVTMLDFIKSLRPVSFHKLNPADWDEAIKPHCYKKHVNTDGFGKEEIREPDKREPDNPNLMVGLIAQEMEAEMKTRGIDFHLVPTGNDGMKAIRYTDLIPIIISAIQELSRKVG